MSINFNDTTKHRMTASRFWIAAVIAFVLSTVLLVGYSFPVEAHANAEPLLLLDEGGEATSLDDDGLDLEDEDETFQLSLPMIPAGWNRPPVAVDDVYQIIEDTSLAADAAEGVLDNDSDPDGETLSAVLVTDVSNGTLNLNGDGSFDYAPNAGFNGQDNFTYRANDGALDSNVATVTIVVQAGSSAPVATDDSYQVLEDTPLTVNAADGVLANDSTAGRDSLRAVLATGVSSGTLDLNLDGSFHYAPEANFDGQDSFTYRADDGVVDSIPATVTMTVQAMPDAPVATVDGYQMSEDTSLAVSATAGVLDNDSDFDGDELQALLVTGVSSGTLNLNLDGSFEYQPDLDFNGQDSFTYRANDGTIDSNPATVTLTVQALPDAPVAANDGYQMLEDTRLATSALMGILVNDFDPEGDAFQAELVTDVSNGMLDLAIDGSFDYAPNPDFFGQDSFAYVAHNVAGASTPATVTLTVDGVNDWPQIVTGAPGFTKQIIDDTVNQAHSAYGADLDGDSDIDIVATDYINDAVYWYQNDASGNFAKHVLDANLDGAYPSHIADVDLDGDNDVLAGGYDGDTFAWYRNDGSGGFIRIDIDVAADGAHSIVTGDLDRDGDVDLITSSQDANRIAWYENDGALNFTEQIIDDASLSAKRAEMVDFDGDGDMDVVTAVTADHEVNWHENDGNQNFTKRLIKKWASGAYFVSPADVDGDGDIDVFSASQWGDEIAWYENEGTEVFPEHIIDGAADGARSVFAVDMDRDGDVDVLAASVEDDTIAWHENDGNGNFTQHPIDGTVDGAYGVSAVDMDHDGDFDVLATGRDDDTVTIFYQRQLHTVAVSEQGVLPIDAAMLRTTDIDDGPTELTYTITVAPEFGEVRLSEAPVVTGGTFTQDDVDNGRLTYVHTGANRISDGFVFTVADGGEEGFGPLGGAFDISIERATGSTR